MLCLFGRVQGKRNEIALQMLINGILVTDEDVRGKCCFNCIPAYRQAGAWNLSRSFSAKRGREGGVNNAGKLKSIVPKEKA